MWRLLVLLVLLPFAALAQDGARPAILVADDLMITGDRVLIARGNVEAFHGDTRLRAREIRFDQRSGALSISGPIVLSEGADTVILADAAQLDRNLQEGLLTGARLVLNQQLQLAAVQINRTQGRYSQLYKTAVTSCHVCTDGSAPLWQIRAKRVVHDKLEKQLYFDGAQFRIKDVPVFYIPRLRLPDPSVERATGFLVPSLRNTSDLGLGLKMPYFIRIGDHKDLTLTPYLSSSTRTLEFKYRQAFVNGRIQFDGAVSRDDERPDKTRGYVFGTGKFDLPRDFTLSFAVQTVSDNSYLKDYGYSDTDRLRSEITVQRVRRDEYIRSSVYNFESLRDTEDNDTLPNFIIDGEYERRLFPRAMGGELRLSLAAHSHYRTSDLNTDSADADAIVDGRDVARLHGGVQWLRGWTLWQGLRAEVRTGARFDVFDISQDSTVPQTQSDVTPYGAVTLRLPLVRRGAGGVVQTLEPLAQLAFSGGHRLAIPNEESTRVEFDSGNFLALSRFPQADRRERGLAGAWGVNWARIDPTGWDAHVAIAQVIRKDADTAFSQTSGLSGTASSYLLAAQIKTRNGLALTGRSLISTGFSLAKTELRGDYAFRRGRIGGSYVWLGADAAEDRARDVSEIALDGDYEINRFWTASADWRYDVDSDRASTAGLGFRYENECVSVDLSVKRRYTSSTSIEPSTSIGLNIGLRGFAARGQTERYVRSCN